MVRFRQTLSLDSVNTRYLSHYMDHLKMVSMATAATARLDQRLFQLPPPDRGTTPKSWHL